MGLADAKSEFVEGWGQFGSDWGINRTMARIHGLLLVTPEPLDTDRVMEELAISRGNASTNLRGLVDWGVVRKVHRPGVRRELYEAEMDLWEVGYFFKEKPAEGDYLDYGVFLESYDLTDPNAYKLNLLQALPGDTDGDRDVDTDDYFTLSDNFYKAGAFDWTGGDFDGDEDVDLADFAVFAHCFTGLNVTTIPAGCESDSGIAFPATQSYETAGSLAGLSASISGSDGINGLIGVIEVWVLWRTDSAGRRVRPDRRCRRGQHGSGAGRLLPSVPPDPL